VKLYLVRRWGQNPAGQTITVEDDAQAAWLLDHNYAQRTKSSSSASANAAAPGTDGPDLRAGGDGTRRRPTSIRSTDKRENRAWPVAGSPVQYNAGVAPTQQGGGDEASSSDSDEGQADGQAEASAPSSKVSGSGRRKSS
jgi:hypothetical protein